MVFISTPAIFRVVILVVALSSWTAAFDNGRNDNLAVYWGQNSYGATHGDHLQFQKEIGYYCNDDSIDAIPIAFLNVFYSTGGYPSINLANICNGVDGAVFPGTSLAKCEFLAAGIKQCQARGKIVTLSLGGASASGGFSSDAAAEKFADLIWNLFLGGSSPFRPFGDAVLDGIDLDIEGGSPSGYTAFVNRLRTRHDKKYYITAAPQCVYPDASLGSVLNSAFFDAVYVQFYNNPCGLQNFNSVQNWNYGIWDYWARNISPNRNVKVYIGAPADATAAGGGYQNLASLKNIAQTMRKNFPTFGGVMLWDASQAHANGRYDSGVKAFLRDGGGRPFEPPICTAPAWKSGGDYRAGSTVSYQGYMWTAKWWPSRAPGSDPNNEWSAISACAGGSAGGPSDTSSTSEPTVTSTESTTSEPTVTPTESTTAPTPTQTGGSGCSGVAAWANNVAYSAGMKVTFNGHLWTAKWWTQAEIPADKDGSPWTDSGPCLLSRLFKF